MRKIAHHSSNDYVVDISTMTLKRFTYIRNRILGTVNMSTRTRKWSSVSGCLILVPRSEQVFIAIETMSTGHFSHSRHQGVYSLVKVRVVTNAYLYNLPWHKHWTLLTQRIYVFRMTVTIISHYLPIWHETPNFYWQGAKTIIVGWFADLKWKNNNKSYS